MHAGDEREITQELYLFRWELENTCMDENTMNYVYNGPEWSKNPLDGLREYLLCKVVYIRIFI